MVAMLYTPFTCSSHYWSPMMTSSNGNIFRITGPLYGEFTGLGEFPAQGQWRGALMFSLIYAWINDWVNNREVGDLRCHRGHYDVIVMLQGDFNNTLKCEQNCHNFAWITTLGLVRQQAKTWTDVDQDPWCHMASLGHTDLTHWGQDKMAAISQTTFSNAFSWMKMF